MAEQEEMTKKVTAPKAATAVKKTAKLEKAAKTEEKVPAKISKFTRTVFDLAGSEVGTVELPEEVFGAKINEPLLLQALRVYQANQHLGLSSSKGRGEVRGGGRKPWKQKGTGRARQGSIRSPQWRGGGVVHGPVSRDVSLDLPTKMKRAALRSALATKLADVLVVDSFKIKEPKTKIVSDGLKKLNLTGQKLLLVLTDSSSEVVRASRNIKKLNLTKVQDLNAWQVIYSGKLVLSKDSLDILGAKENGKEKKNDAN
jgi:large subunit ribosomal protein L4